ncbi:MAG: hypothetical protein A2277_04915 [Desulfobacterales bacterium RIFOXYA12_FULL_46_15]|nr:MAG: hypothetical protein A2097_05745 [Desulfobacula sp. GWF2_41_7]OGR25349.1 MAG: hypothetical protein A2277_04915 [Desulfobacterales bacterium RIFOXYA12_FULL_46_15]
MNPDQISPLFENYQTFVKRVDSHITAVKRKFPNRIACKKGCDLCCKFLTLFPVEALTLAQAFAHLPKKIKAKVILKIETEKDVCPLLIDRACVLYPFRPIICRTHGYPVYMEKDRERLIDFCPRNFKGITSFPKETMLDIEQLNTLLAMINRQFTESLETDPPFLDRIPISEAIFILCS